MTLLTSSHDMKYIKEIKIMAAIRDFMNSKKMLLDENGMNNPIITRKRVMDHIARHNPQLADGTRLTPVSDNIKCPIYKWNGDRLHTFQNYRCPKCGQLFIVLLSKQDTTGMPIQRPSDPAFCPCKACVAYVGHKCTL